LLASLADSFLRVAIQFLVKIMLSVVPRAVFVFRTLLSDFFRPALFAKNPEATVIATPA